MKYAIELEKTTKKYGDYVAVREIDLKVPEGAFISFLGSSGCGKSTTLRLIAGLEECDGGKILFRGQDITHVPPAFRDMRMMFQDYALFPNMTVLENIKFPMTVRRTRDRFRGQVDQTARKYLELVHMETFADRKPHQLSGGQRQRVALARALVSDPAVVLFDEPLGALDATLRHAMQFELKRIHAEYGKTFISVTHDQEEAMAMSDLIALMRDGKILQVGTPTEIYSRPNCRYVAEFIGAGSAVLDAKIVRKSGDGVLVDIGKGLQLLSKTVVTESTEGNVVGLHLRPELIQLSADAAGSESTNVLAGTLKEYIFLGGRTEFKVALSAAPEMVLTVSRSGPPRANEVEGANVTLTLPPETIGVLEK